MRVRLVGIHTVKAKAADGTPRIYRYAWRGGPRLDGVPGSPEFMASYQQAIASRQTVKDGTLGGLVTEFKASSAFTRLRERTRGDYLRYLDMIEARFGRMPVEALADPRSRGDFMVWRDGMAATPRKADLAWTILARVLSVAVDRGRLTVNPCARGGRLYAVDRSEAVWTEDAIERFLAAASEPLRRALILALWTGQRQGDLLRLTWAAYDGSVIRLRQSKTGARLAIKVGEPLRAVLDAVDRKAMSAVSILTNSDGGQWTSDGFRASWRKTCIKAGIAGLTFHDLRGSAVTRLALAGCSVAEIASITGHSLGDAQEILDTHYLGGRPQLAEAAIIKLEQHISGTARVKDL